MKAAAAGHAAGGVLRTLLKITKGVVGVVYPDDWMPVDKFGIRADLWIDMNSPVARNNPGQLYECGINRISEFVQQEVGRVYEVQGSEAAFNVLTDWYSDVNENWGQLCREKMDTPARREQLVKDAVEDFPKIHIPPFLNNLTPKDDDFWHALRNIKKWQLKWGAETSPVTYKTLQADGTGKEFTTIQHFAIGYKSILQLNKIPEITAPGFASVNHMGIPTRSNYDAKYFPVSTNPYRYGEDEMRIMSMDSDIREVVRFLSLLANSPAGTATLIQSQLRARHPSRIRRVPMSNGDLLRSNVVLRLVHNTMAVLGVESKATKVEQIDLPDYLTDSIWSADVLDVRNRKNLSWDEEVVSKSASNKRDRLKKMMEVEEDDDDDEDDILEEAEIVLGEAPEE